MAAEERRRQDQINIENIMLMFDAQKRAADAARAQDKADRDALGAQKKADHDAARAQEKAYQDATRAQERAYQDAASAQKRAYQDAARAQERILFQKKMQNQKDFLQQFIAALPAAAAPGAAN